MSWLIVPDVVYALLQERARSESTTVDALVLRELSSASMAPTDDGKPFKVWSASEIDRRASGTD